MPKLTLLSALYLALLAAPDDQVVLHVLDNSNPQTVVAESVTPPMFEFRVEEGAITDRVVVCRQRSAFRTRSNVTYPVVVLECGTARLVLTGIDLIAHK